MSNINYLNGSIYHMVHFDNLKNILERRGILSKAKVLQEGIGYRSIAFDTVQNLRDRIYIYELFKQHYRRLHSYVPFYFAILTPMLHVQFRRGMQNEMVIFERSRMILTTPGVLFTDGNASNQQLSKYEGERVGIKPETLERECERIYHPRGPLGTNTNRSNIFADIECLHKLDWDCINDRWFFDEERRRIKHAEVLVPDIVPLGRIQSICVRTQEMARRVNVLIAEHGLAGRIPSATVRAELYF